MQPDPINTLDAELLEAFAGFFLSYRYDNARPSPQFHREVWADYTSEKRRVAVAAPRDHAKSTAFTHDFILATVLFHIESYVLLLGASEEMSQEHLQNISTELHDNELFETNPQFKVKKWIVDQKTEIQCIMGDGWEFRIVARGAEQRIRGRLWKGRRPGLIVCDDIEEDEAVENKDRRDKFKMWFLRAAKQALRFGGRIRVHGTILHEDSLLANLIKADGWNGRIYRAHKGFDDFADILWPEKFTARALQIKRDEFVSMGDAAGYSAEWLNDPLDNDERFFRRQDFLPMEPQDHETDKLYLASADLAVSKSDKYDKTSMGVSGMDLRNVMHMVDKRGGRWDSLEIIEQMFSIQARYDPVMFALEGGAITQTFLPVLYNEMQRRGKWINVVVIQSTQDKRRRAVSIQRRMRAGSVRWDMDAEWFPGVQDQMLRFTGYSKNAGVDDDVDMVALNSLAWEQWYELEQSDFEGRDSDDDDRVPSPPRYSGRSTVTGY